MNVSTKTGNLFEKKNSQCSARFDLLWPSNCLSDDAQHVTDDGENSAGEYKRSLSYEEPRLPLHRKHNITIS